MLISRVRRSMRSAAFTRRSMPPGPVFRYLVARGLLRRRDARGRNGAWLASASGQAGAHARAGSRRGLLPDQLAVAAGTFLAALSRVRTHFVRSPGNRSLFMLQLPFPDRRVMHVVPGFVLAAVAAHCISPMLCARPTNLRRGMSAVQPAAGGSSS